MKRPGLTKRILVTGDTGFLGSHFCDRLLVDKSEVIYVDNLYTGQREIELTVDC